MYKATLIINIPFPAGLSFSVNGLLTMIHIETPKATAYNIHVAVPNICQAGPRPLRSMISVFSASIVAVRLPGGS